MKVVLIILLFSFAAFGQVRVVERSKEIPTEREQAESLKALSETYKEVDRSKWKLAGFTADSPITRWFYRDIQNTDSYRTEVWLKVVQPANERIVPIGRNKKQSYAYMLQYFVFYCSDKRYSIEETVFYAANGSPIRSPFMSLFGSVFRRPVAPNTVGEGLFSFFC